MLRRAAQKHRNLQNILAKAEQDPAGGLRLASQTADLVSGLEGEEAGQVLHALATRYHRGGRGDMAAETFELLASRYPKHRLRAGGQAVAGAILVQRGGRLAHATHATRHVQKVNGPPAPPTARGGRDDKGGVAPASFELEEQEGQIVLADPAVQEERWKKASELAKEIERTSPGLFAEPTLRFPLATAHRRLGYGRQAERFYLAVRHGSAGAAWSACAAGERWLAEPQGDPPKAIARCKRPEASPISMGSSTNPFGHTTTAWSCTVH